MIHPGRAGGVIALVGSLALTVAGLRWLVGARADGVVGTAGFAASLLLLLGLGLPAMATGIYLVARGRFDVEAFEASAKVADLVDRARASGRLRVGDAVVALGLPRERLRSLLYDAVADGQFSGYVHWREGVLGVAELVEGPGPCPYCGGTISLRGRGVFLCPYCGVELFAARGRRGMHAIEGLEPPPAEGKAT